MHVIVIPWTKQMRSLLTQSSLHHLYSLNYHLTVIPCRNVCFINREKKYSWFCKTL